MNSGLWSPTGDGRHTRKDKDPGIPRSTSERSPHKGPAVEKDEGLEVFEMNSGLGGQGVMVGMREKTTTWVSPVQLVNEAHIFPLAAITVFENHIEITIGSLAPKDMCIVRQSKGGRPDPYCLFW